MNERYIRHIQLEEVGNEGQQKLGNAKVLVVGAGGLGCPILQYLATSGIGTLGIVDFDTVSVSNLHRQILYTANDVGKSKALVAQEQLQHLNPDINVEAYPTALTVENCLDILKPYDIIVDGTDNFVTRYLINDACLLLDKPMVFGALYKFEGQVSVFNYQNGPSYRCLFPNPPAANEVPNCNAIGVLGVLPGIIGLLQATEVLKIILGIGEVLSGKVLYLNALTYQQRLLTFLRNEAIIASVKKNVKPKVVSTDDCIFTRSLSLNDIDTTETIVWIDVREVGETPIVSAAAVISLPLSSFESSLNLQDDGKKYIFFCQSGLRSQKAAQLAQEKGLLHCFSLKEGALELQHWLTY